MNLSVITKYAKPIVNITKKGIYKLSKHSPEILLVSGIVCGVASVVSGCMASRKVDYIIDETHAELDSLQEYIDENKIENPKKEILKVYAKTGWKMIKLYSPTLILTTTSVGLILTSHGILQKRYIGVAAMANALNDAFNDYKKRVMDLIGEDAEKALSMGAETCKDIKVENDDGTVETIKGKSQVIKNPSKSPYEFDFNAFTAPDTWSGNTDYLHCFLEAQQRYATNLLTARGHIFLNEVLDMLGLQRTPEGQIVGWFKGAGDDYVDFGISETYYNDSRLDTDLFKKNVHMKFNVDGIIYDMI